MKFKEYIYRYTYNILFYSDSGFGGFVAHSWPIRGPFVAHEICLFYGVFWLFGRSVAHSWGIRGPFVGDSWPMKFACFTGFFGFLDDPWPIRGPFVGDSWPIRGP